MSRTSQNPPRRAVPAQLGFLAIYNPSLGTTDDTIENQILYYSTPEPRGDENQKQDYSSNERLRQIGLAQGMVEFGRSFSDGRSVDTVETEKARIVLHELEAGWWILASINLTILTSTTKTVATKDKASKEEETVEYSSREVKPAILILGDLLRAHSTFLLHHASSMSALFVRTRRPKFIGLLGRYWDTFLSTWNVLMHGNPASTLYGGIKIAACGELGVGVGEEERGSGEREVLEGFVDRMDGLVDVIVSKFGEGDSTIETAPGKMSLPNPTSPWLGSGNEPRSEDGAIFLGTGALSRKSLRDVSHWMEDLYRWGGQAYGVVDNPSSNRRAKKVKSRRKNQPEEALSEAHVYGHTHRLSIRGSDPTSEDHIEQNSSTIIPPKLPDENDIHDGSKSKTRRPSFRRAFSSKSAGSMDSNSNQGNKFVQYLKFGYGTHWSLGGSSKNENVATETSDSIAKTILGSTGDGVSEGPAQSDDSLGYFLIGLMGNIEEGNKGEGDEHPHDTEADVDSGNGRLLLRTLTLELEREEDARAEIDISIDLGTSENDGTSSKRPGSEHTGTSKASFESQDRNKTKKLRVVVYVKKPFMFVFLFELRSSALAFPSLYHLLHYQIGPLHKPLISSTSFRASRPEINTTGQEDPRTPIYDLVWDPRLLTVNSTIPNIPNPYQSSLKPGEPATWSRVEALNTHLQIVNTYVAITTSTEGNELERTLKTSRGWWIVWTRVPDPEPPAFKAASGAVKIPGSISEDSTLSTRPIVPSPQSDRNRSSREQSTFSPSMNSGPAHPYLENPSEINGFTRKDKEIFLIRRASDYGATGLSGRFANGPSTVSDSSWTSGQGKLAHGIGVDTKRYIEGLLNLNS